MHPRHYCSKKMPPKSQSRLLQRTDCFETNRSRNWDCFRCFDYCSRTGRTGVGEARLAVWEEIPWTFSGWWKGVVLWLLLLQIAVKGTFLYVWSCVFAPRLRPPKGRHNTNERKRNGKRETKSDGGQGRKRDKGRKEDKGRKGEKGRK